MNTILGTAAFLTLIVATPAFAQETPHRMNEHPAVIIKREAAKQPYDYASKFYPHPAWLYLQSAPSPEAGSDVATRSDRDSSTETGSSTVAIAGGAGVVKPPVRNP
jgi:hypothetical protein